MAPPGTCMPFPLPGMSSVPSLHGSGVGLQQALSFLLSQSCVLCHVSQSSPNQWLLPALFSGATTSSAWGPYVVPGIQSEIGSM